MKNLQTIGFRLPAGNKADYVELESLASLADVDIAVITPDFKTSYYNFSSNGYEGRRLFSQTHSPKIYEYIKHWNREINDYLLRGGNLFVILIKQETFYAYTGKKQVSGTGRNARTTNLVESISNYDIFPFKLSPYNAEGKTIIKKSAIIHEFYKQFCDFLSYEAYLGQDIPDRDILFSTKNGERVLGAIINYHHAGNIIVLPAIDFDPEGLSDEPDDGSEEIREWADKITAKSVAFRNSIVAIDKVLKQDTEKSIAPDWINDDTYNLTLSTTIYNKINKLEKKKEEIDIQLQELNLELKEQNNLKDLLYETGKPLEKAVIKALRLLGYSAENYDNGDLELDQIILSPEGDRFIGECEGKENKDIDITKFRQLQDGLNADFEREEVQEKAYGLLIGNPQRIIAPANRTLDFTAKCKSGAAREKIGLIKTSDLFFVCQHLSNSNDKDYAKKCREAIKSQLGSIIVFPSPKK